GKLNLLCMPQAYFKKGSFYQTRRRTSDFSVIPRPLVCVIRFSPGALPFSILPYLLSIFKNLAPFKVAHFIVWINSKSGKFLCRVFNSDKIQSLSLDARLSVPIVILKSLSRKRSILGSRFSI